ncbi:MAG: Gfo/Idh/MocA family protein [Chitinophagales bacterium]
MAKVKFAILGCGHIGKRHADVILQNPDAELIALCDVKTKEELELEKFDVPFFHHIDKLLNSGIAYDVVNICTPNGLHAKHALAALHTNRNVLIEKPLALKAEHCKWIIQKAKEKEKKVFCVMQNRFSPPAVLLKELISKNILGKIYMLSVNCFWNRDERYYTGNTWHGAQELDGGTLFTQFSHYIDLLYWLIGDIEDITAQFADFNHQKLTDFEDSGSFQFRFQEKAIGTFQYSTSVLDKNFESSITIIGENGTIKAGGQYMEDIIYCNIKNYQPPDLPKTNKANHYGAYTGSAANHQQVIQNVIDVFQEKSSMAATAEEGMQVVNIIERIYSLRPASVLKS